VNASRNPRNQSRLAAGLFSERRQPALREQRGRLSTMTGTDRLSEGPKSLIEVARASTTATRCANPEPAATRLQGNFGNDLLAALGFVLLLVLCFLALHLE